MEQQDNIFYTEQHPNSTCDSDDDHTITARTHDVPSVFDEWGYIDNIRLTVQHMKTLYFRLNKETTQEQQDEIQNVLTDYLKVTGDQLSKLTKEEQKHILVRNNISQLIQFLEFFYQISTQNNE